MKPLPLRRIVLDTGVLIALFDRGDKDHQLALLGFAELERQNTELIVPSAVVLETAKRLFFDTTVSIMRHATQVMLENMGVLDTTPFVIRDALELTQTMSGWGATLEDAIVINTALTLNAPVWTMNYRDFAAIKNLQFWSPE